MEAHTLPPFLWRVAGTEKATWSKSADKSGGPRMRNLGRSVAESSIARQAPVQIRVAILPLGRGMREPIVVHETRLVAVQVF